MKKLLSVILFMTLVISLTACGQAPTAETTVAPTTAETVLDCGPLEEQAWEAYYASDYEKAVQLFSRGAEAGCLKCLASMGDAYTRLGRYEDAEGCFQQMIDLGDTNGMLHIGAMYATFLEDYDAAIQWLEKGAEAGNTLCMCELGHMYDHGLGVPQDKAKAQQWYEQAGDIPKN